MLVFEDLHWADPGTLDFIDHLVEWSRGVPILVITVARPELFEHRPDWGAGRRNFVALGLEPLLDSPRSTSCSASSCRACPMSRCARSPSVPTASRCTRSRPSGCWSRRAAWCRRRRLRPVGRPDQPRRAGDAARAHRRPARRVAAGRTRADPGCRGARAELHRRRPGRRERHGPRARRGVGPVARPPRAARPRRRPAVGRARPVRLRPGAHPRGRVRDPGAARPPQSATWPPPGSSSRSARTSWRARSPRTTSPPTARRPTIPTAGRWRHRRRSPSAPPRRERARSAATTRR